MWAAKVCVVVTVNVQQHDDKGDNGRQQPQCLVCVCVVHREHKVTQCGQRAVVAVKGAWVYLDDAMRLEPQAVGVCTVVVGHNDTNREQDAPAKCHEDAVEDDRDLNSGGRAA